MSAGEFPYRERAFEEQRCRRLCCPVAVPHTRVHPCCSQGPRLWQDEGDQA